VDGQDQLGEDICEPRSDSGGRQTKGSRHQPCNAIDRETARKLSGLCPAHAVAHGEDEIRTGQGSVPCLNENCASCPSNVSARNASSLLAADPAHVGEPDQRSSAECDRGWEAGWLMPRQPKGFSETDWPLPASRIVGEFEVDDTNLPSETR